MSEIHFPPASFGFKGEIDATSLASQVSPTGLRLLSLKSYLKGNTRKLAAIWIKENNPGWGWKPSIKPTDLATTLKNTDSRLITLDAFWEKNAVLCAAAWIPRKGVVWNWTPQTSFADLKSQLHKEDGRLTCLRSYVADGVRVFSAIWIKKDVVDWDWDPAITHDALVTKIDNGAQYLVSLDAYVDAGVLKFAAVWIKNTQYAFFWNVGLSEALEKSQYDHFCAYPIDLVPTDIAAGQLATAMYQYPIPLQPSANILKASGNLAINSIGDLGSQNSSGTLTVANLTSATIDASQTTCYELTTGGSVLNSYPAFGSKWIFAANSPSIPPSGNVSSNISPGPDICCAELLVELAASNGADKQLSHVAIPFSRSGYPAPPAVQTPTPLFFGVWTNPVEVIPLWSGKKGRWLTLAGNLTKPGNGTILITQLHVKIVADKTGKTLIDKDLDLSQIRIYDPMQQKLVSATMVDLAAQLQGPQPVFLYGMPFNSDFPNGTMTMWANYKLDGKCGGASISIPVKNITPVTLRPPVAGSWNFGNSPNHTGFDSHASVHKRYSVDLSIIDPNTGLTRSSSNGVPAPIDQNTSYLCWNKPIYCMLEGDVRSVDDSNVDNKGGKGGSGPPNYVIIDHGGGLSSGYFHVKQDSILVGKSGQPTHVLPGTQIASVGNAGNTSEPHLHLEFRTDNDVVGRSNHLPMQFSNLFVAQGGAAVVGVPATGIYFAVV
jgi:hypothetical protein